jgi:uncharacterized protein YozE (UPF0346 family)
MRSDFDSINAYLPTYADFIAAMRVDVDDFIETGECPEPRN